MSLLPMYSKAGNLDQAKDSFESLKKQGCQPDMKAYTFPMITAYVKAGLPKDGDALTREIEARDIKPTREIYMELLRAFAREHNAVCRNTADGGTPCITHRGQCSGWRSRSGMRVTLTT